MVTCFKVASDEVLKPLLIMLNEGIRFARLVYTRPWTSKVSCSFFYYNGIPLKELDFGLHKPTASIILVSPGLDCLGVSLAEVCATCLRCHLW